jgi:hypothetical protein
MQPPGTGPPGTGPPGTGPPGTGPPGTGRSVAERGVSGGWELLRAAASAPAVALRAPAPDAPGLCRTCFGPAQPGRARCFPCSLHAECAPGLLASVVVPVAYAVKGGPHARSLWVYKSRRDGTAAARRALTVLLLTFLHEHGPCVWRAAGWAGPDQRGRPGLLGPTHLAVVPSSRGRGGPHPLRGLVEPYLRLPWASLSACPDAAGDIRDLDPGRFAAGRLAGGRVLLLDDTWTTGASVQSAALALRHAGAAAVAAVVLGRHLARSRPGHPGPRTVAFTQRLCAVHGAQPGGAPGA